MVLNSWKEIANYMALSVRSAQRWAATYGMPVRRAPRSSRVVFALTKEMDEWLETAPRAQKLLQETRIPPKSSKAATILAVDDNEIHLYALRKVLLAAGFTVVAARTGSEAIRKAIRHAPDAILLDVHLPDVNGFEVCRRIKAEEKAATIPIIFHSASNDCGQAPMQAKTLGAAAFLSYPMQYQNILAVLKASLTPPVWPEGIDKFSFDTQSRMSL